MKIFSVALALLLVLGLFSSLTAQDKKLTTVNLGYAAISGSFAPLGLASIKVCSRSTAWI